MISGDDAARLVNATKAWRDSLLMLGGRNRLLNYKPTRSSTLEFVQVPADDVIAKLSSKKGVPVVGLVPPKAPDAEQSDDLDELEQAALDVIEAIDITQHPDHLFVNKTQRETDRTLRNLARAASREYLDRGLSVLYLALGALRWQEDNGDPRLSPLLFLPVELHADGPKQPHRLYPSPEDLVSNPALAIRLREQGIHLPEQAEIDQIFADGGVAAVENRMRGLQLPSGWAVEPLCILSTFMFAKEAMYRDLEVNESRIQESSLVQALSGVTVSGEFGQLTFEPTDPDAVDVVSPPETTPLILDADSTQRVAVSAAVAGRSFVMDGPPGTGKSQTIANMIAALIADEKRVLFVSEKAVALDVVRDRLAARGLGSLLFELHSHNATRSAVAKALGTALAHKPVVDERPDDVATRARPVREELTAYAAAMNERRAPMGWTLFEALGEAERLPSTGDLPAFRMEVEWLTAERWEQVGDLEFALSRLWSHVRSHAVHPWLGLVDGERILFDVTAAQRALEALIAQLANSAPRRGGLGWTSISQWPEMVAAIEEWEQGLTSWRSRPWLVEADAERLSQDLPQLVARTKQAIADDSEMGATFGLGWIPLGARPTIQPLAKDLSRATGITLESLRGDEATAAADDLKSLAAALRDLGQRGARVADLLSIARPATVAQAETLARGLRVVVGPQRLDAGWLENGAHIAMGEALRQLQEAFAAESHAATEAQRNFAASVSTVDIAPFAQRWRETPTWRKSILGPARSDREHLQQHLVAKPRVAFDALNEVEMWQHARELRTVAQNRFAALFGFVAEDPLSFERAEAILRRIEGYRHSGLALDLAGLRRAQADEAAWALVAPALKGMEDVLEDVRERTLPFVGTDISQPTALLAERIGAAEATSVAIAEVVAAAQPFLTSPAASITDAIDCQSSVQRACESREALQADIAIMEREALPGLEARIDAAWAEEVTARAAWTLRIRAFVTGLAAADAWEALSSLASSNDLAAAGRSWEASRVALIERFEPEYRERVRDHLATEAGAGERLKIWESAADDVTAWLRLRPTMQMVEHLGLTDVLNALLAKDIASTDLAGLLRSAAVAGWISAVERTDPRLESTRLISRDELVEQFRVLDRRMVEKTAAQVLAASAANRPRIASGQTALISAEAEKKRRHIPVRDLIGRASDVIQALHPCFMMSPLAVSQYLPPDIEFDVVIFDEASQVPPGDAINCIYRAKSMIAAGDQRQLPPTSFFAAGPADDDEAEGEENLANDYESLLDLMKSSGGFTSIPLRWHYRSRHESLIAYSNNAFYGDKLVTFPGALAETSDAGVKFFKVDGVYKRSQGQNNPIEAKFVAERVLHHLEHRPGKTIGIVAMSAAQRDAITDALMMLRTERPDLESHFSEDRAGGLFVKSLEEVQGDERDVIVLSIGYGPDSTGVVYRNFGPINKKGGERRLNVAITRAKELTEVVSSMSASDIGEVASDGGRHLRRYLDYAERGAAALEMELGSEGLGTDSPFEDSVIAVIRSWGYDVQPQVGASGFRIDIGVKHPNFPGVFMLGVECDGAMYHSSRTARDRDRLRHDILVGLGWQIYHIWGLDWYRHRPREEARLRERIEEAAATSFSGRLPAQPLPADPVEVRLESAVPSTLSGNLKPEWMLDYEPARLAQLPPYDWTDSGNARHLVSFVETVVLHESPLHIETLKRRLREYSGIERVNKKALRTLWTAIEMSAVALDGEFLRAPGAREPVARHSGGRSLDEVHDEELMLAREILCEHQVGAEEDEIVTAVARAFGWSRTPQGLSYRLHALR